MGPGSRRLFVLATSISIIFFFSLLVGCGGSSHSSTSSGTGTTTGSSGTNGGSTGSGTSGTSSTGTGGTGTSGTGTATGTGSTSGGGTGSSSGSGSGSTSSSYSSYVYTAGASSITGYGVNADGSLTAIPGSPFAVATDNNIVTNGSNVYTVDADGQTLKVYSISESSGALTFGSSTNAISSQTFSGDIVSNLSLDHTGATLYAGNVDSSGDDGLNEFNVSSGSSATAIGYTGNSEAFGPPLVFSPDNKYVYNGNCYHIGWSTFRYARNSDGTLTSLPGPSGADSPPVAPPSGDDPCPSAYAVSAKGFLAIAYTDTPQGGTYMIGTYKINSDGSLTPVSGSQATTASNGGTTGNTSVAIDFDPTGTWLAVAGNGGVQTFAMDSSGLPSPAGAPQDAGVSFLNVEWDKSNHLFATTSSQLYVWNASGGQLTPASGSPQSGGTGLAVLPLQ